MQAINTAYYSRDAVLEQLQQNIDTVLSEAEQPAENVDGRLEELQKELLKLANRKVDYFEIADEIDRLQKLKQNALVEKADRESMKQRIEEMKGFLTKQKHEITTYNEQLVRKLIEKITVYDDKFTVEFKSGTSLEVER